ncbi:serine/threonine-protein kinase/endoribonuclease IRE1-like [Xenia sp. Carnegie-2017]|uniref:serine/threonine-protein kinase/endoribonuclease IRE1-like n=1 Tax=Xenia sp. Carnegie-2017 TaxID=2897299 RepID=UPI001F03CD00|nr:serine/threonine-protein kinase/endoribonuclease IRE1-like [Xenia sp. Carnegie-2017]
MLNGIPVGLDEIKDETLKDLLSWMLKLQPEERPSANEALKHPFLMSDDEKFHFLCKVGDLQSIKTNDPQSSIVQQLNIESSNWKSQMDSDVYEYLVNGRKYGSSWTECLRLIRNIGQHLHDRPLQRPQPKPIYKIGDHKAYFLKTYPSLPVRIHAAVRSNDELKDNAELKAIFSGEEKKKRCFQADLRYTKLTTEEIEKICQKVGTDWNILGGLLEIPFDIRADSIVDDTIYPNPSAKAKEILVIFNEGKKFDRYVLKKCLEEVMLDLDEILSPTSQTSYRSFLENLS